MDCFGLGRQDFELQDQAGRPKDRECGDGLAPSRSATEVAGRAATGSKSSCADNRLGFHKQAEPVPNGMMSRQSEKLHSLAAEGTGDSPASVAPHSHVGKT